MVPCTEWSLYEFCDDGECTTARQLAMEGLWRFDGRSPCTFNLLYCQVSSPALASQRKGGALAFFEKNGL